MVGGVLTQIYGVGGGGVLTQIYGGGGEVGGGGVLTQIYGGGGGGGGGGTDPDIWWGFPRQAKFCSLIERLFVHEKRNPNRVGNRQKYTHKKTIERECGEKPPKRAGFGDETRGAIAQNPLN